MMTIIHKIEPENETFVARCFLHINDHACFVCPQIHVVMCKDQLEHGAGHHGPPGEDLR